MKLSIVICSLFALGACASGEKDCWKIDDPNYRDLCFTEQLQDKRIDETEEDETPSSEENL